MITRAGWNTDVDMGEWHNLRNDRLRIEKKLRFHGCDNLGLVGMVSCCAISEYLGIYL